MPKKVLDAVMAHLQLESQIGGCGGCRVSLSASKILIDNTTKLLYYF